MPRFAKRKFRYAYFSAQYAEYGPSRFPEDAASWLQGRGFSRVNSLDRWVHPNFGWRAEVHEFRTLQLASPRDPSDPQFWSPNVTLSYARESV